MAAVWSLEEDEMGMAHSTSLKFCAPPRSTQSTGEMQMTRLAGLMNKLAAAICRQLSAFNNKKRAVYRFDVSNGYYIYRVVDYLTQYL